MLASVFADPQLGQAPSVFINKNFKDFADPAIQADLASRQCRFIANFAKGHEYLESLLRPRH